MMWNGLLTLSLLAGDWAGATAKKDRSGWAGYTLLNPPGFVIRESKAERY
jgi:hypothetical protein